MGWDGAMLLTPRDGDTDALKDNSRWYPRGSSPSISIYLRGGNNGGKKRRNCFFFPFWLAGAAGRGGLGWVVLV